MKLYQKILCLFFLPAISWGADVTILREENYLGGKAFCNHHEKLISYEKGFYTTVPSDYSNPQASQFDMYAWFQEGFDPEKPTVVYLTGGPGQTSHWGQSALYGEFNLLLVDQRGIACSRPRTYEDYLSPSFYSAENIARDLEELRKKLKINKWTVYGVSFGTIPATIYGSLYPERTRSLILEGVVYNAKDLWSTDGVKAILKMELTSQSELIQSRVSKLNADWFFLWAKTQLLMNEGRMNLHDNLSKLSDLNEYQDFIDMLEAQYGPQEAYEKNDLYELNEVPYYMLTCQEMGLLDGNCSLLNLEVTDEYLASAYPVTVPTFYFQGENDPATSAVGAYKHFSDVARGPKQFLLLKEGGHNPNLEILRGENLFQKEILMNAIHGNPSRHDVIDAVNSELSVVKWLLK